MFNLVFIVTLGNLKEREYAKSKKKGRKSGIRAALNLKPSVALTLIYLLDPLSQLKQRGVLMCRPLLKSYRSTLFFLGIDSCLDNS